MDRPPAALGMQHQLAIYLAAERGRAPAVPIDPGALEREARLAMRPEAYDYVAGAAGSEETAHANRAAFTAWQIVPRMLRDVSERDLSVELLGRRLPFPLLLAPVGVLGIARREAEPAVARAAAGVGVPIVLSTLSDHTLEQVAEAAGDGVRWFQLYWGRDREVTASMLARAEAAGYGAVVFTLDTKMLGWRVRDLQRGYLPFFHGAGLANYFADPAFRASLAAPPEENPRAAVERFSQIYVDPSLTWDDLAWLREHTRLPIVLKGIQHADDARAALDHGVEGIVVSNHGGRQVDGGIGSLTCLPEVAAAVDGRAHVLFDSGIRRGADAFKALALGADAVLLGRPYVYGLALASQRGVREVVLNLLAELDLTVALSGYRSVAELDASALRPAPA